MADKLPFPHHTVGSYQSLHSTTPHRPRHTHSPSLSATPSPSRSPAPKRKPHSMFTNSYQQGQPSRMGMMYNLQHQNVRQQQQPTPQHMHYHTGLHQQHHSTDQGLNGGVLVHQS